MPKLTGTNTTVKISISQIIETGNVRHEYSDKEIDELADSILAVGLLTPLGVKRAQTDDNGIQMYELVYGHRRIRALRRLCERGNDYSLVEVHVVTGDKAMMQLIENIQREDLTPKDKEKAITDLIASGRKQSDIAKALCKSEQWISDIVAASGVRAVAEAAGVDTSALSGKAVAQFRSLPEEKVPEAMKMLTVTGGSVRQAKQVRDYLSPGKKHRENDSPTVRRTISSSAVYNIITLYEQQAKGSDKSVRVKVAEELRRKFEEYFG